MNTNDGSSNQTIQDRAMCGVLAFCTSFMLWIWIAAQLGIPVLFSIVVFILLAALDIVICFIIWSCQTSRRIIEPPLLSRKPSHDSGYTSQYGSINTPEERLKISNEDRFCQLCTLRAQKRTLQNEIEVLNQKARDAYEKHSKASRFFLEHDAHKMACFGTSSHAFDASRAWYTADLERTMKNRQLENRQQRIKELREEMQDHFWDVV